MRRGGGGGGGRRRGGGGGGRRGGRGRHAHGETSRAPVDADSVAAALWRRLVGFVMESHDESRRAIRQTIGLPQGRVRALRWLAPKPLTLSELADVTSTDAPATTVIVNDLEERGLVRREIDPGNRRTKIVSLTASGRAMVERVLTLLDAPPASFTKIPADDLAALGRILDALARPATEDDHREDD